MRPKLVLFDFDGTIADTFQCGVEILNSMAPEFGFRPLAPFDVPRVRDMRTSDLMRFLGIPATRLAKISRRGKEELSRRMDSVQPLPGMLDLVRSLRAAGVRMGILTSNSQDNVAAFLAKFDLDIFEFVHTSSKLAGKGRVVRKILRAHKLKPREILLVGDEIRDIEAAQETGIHVAAVTWGYNSAPALAAIKPDHMLASPGAIADLLRSLPSA